MKRFSVAAGRHRPRHGDSVKTLVAATLLGVFLVVSACGGDTPSQPGLDVFAPEDIRPPYFSDGASHDPAPTPDTSPPRDTEPAPDTTPDTLLDGFEEPSDADDYEWDDRDLRPDRTPPEVIAFSPADGAEGVPAEFVVEVEFNKALNANSVTLNENVKVVNLASGNPVIGQLTKLPSASDVRKIQFRPNQPLMPGTPVSVELTTDIRDRLGTRMERFVRFRFFTAPRATPPHHVELAARYAPTIRQETMSPNPHFNYPTGMDFHGEFDLTAAAAALRTADSVPAKVYYSVIDTESHWFISYIFYYPINYLTNSDRHHSNYMGGLQVVVARYPQERPIMVQVYSKTDAAEDILAYVTAESGLADSFRDRDLIDGVYPQSELFPDGRFQAYLRADSHQSCAWVDRSRRKPPDLCILDETMIDSLPLIVYEYKDGTAESIEKSGASFPSSTAPGETIGYALENLMERLWPRRLDVEPLGDVFSESFEFESVHGRPGKGLAAGSRLLSTEGDFAAYGRPPWAWEWRALVGKYIELKRGTFFLDPAYFLMRRGGALPDWDETQQTGISLDYCYHPYLAVDFLEIHPSCAVD